MSGSHGGGSTATTSPRAAPGTAVNIRTLGGMVAVAIALIAAWIVIPQVRKKLSATSVAESERVEQAREAEKFFVSTADPIELRLAGKVEEMMELSYGEWSRKVSIAERNAHFYFQTVPREIGVAIWVDGESTPRIYGSKDSIRLPERPVRGYRFKLANSSDKGSLRVWVKPEK